MVMGMNKQLVLTLTDPSLRLRVVPQRHFSGSGRLPLLFRVLRREVDFPS